MSQGAIIIRVTNNQGVVQRQPQVLIVRSGLPGAPGVGSAGAMATATYDPQGIDDDAFDLTNHTGVIDCGTFL